MRSTIFIFLLFTISPLFTIGCNQIINRSLDAIKEESKSERIEDNKKISEEIDGTKKEKIPTNDLNKKLHTEKMEQDIDNLTVINSDERRRKYNFIGTTREGPYRSGSVDRINSDK